MGTWIEILVEIESSWGWEWSFPAMGTWIEIFWKHFARIDNSSRSLQWERGLKYVYIDPSAAGLASFPAMGTWIEIYNRCISAIYAYRSFPAMGTWIEIEI